MRRMKELSRELEAMKARLEKQIESMNKHFPSPFKNSARYIKELNKLNIMGRRQKINRLIDNMVEVEQEINHLEN